MLLALQPHLHKTTGNAYFSFKYYLLALPTFEKTQASKNIIILGRQDKKEEVPVLKEKQNKQKQNWKNKLSFKATPLES